MNEVITIGIDLAKNVFQVHGVDAAGEAVIRHQLRRSQVLPFFRKQPPCLIGMEACGTSHFWAREIAALGHEVRLMPPRYVKPYVKRNKNDAANVSFSPGLIRSTFSDRHASAGVGGPEVTRTDIRAHIETAVQKNTASCEN